MPHETDQVPESEAGGWKSWVPESVRHLLPSAAPADDWTQFVPAEWRRWLSDSPAPRPQTRTLRFIGIDEDRPGLRWSALYRETWDAYRAWWLGVDGGRERPGRAAAEAALHHHMPELAEVHAQLVALAGDDDTAAAMLTLWNPPPFIVACSYSLPLWPLAGFATRKRNLGHRGGWRRRESNPRNVPSRM